MWLALSINISPSRIAHQMILAVSLAFLSLNLPAQEASSGISGLVADPSGGVVPGAQVTARNIATNLTTSDKTNASGYYEFPNLPAGSYVLTVVATGFEKTSSTPFTIQTGQSARIDLAVKVGSVSATVTVSASTAQLMNTTSNDLGVTIDARQIENLPVNQRNLFELVALQPGVNADGNTGQNNRGGFEVNGAPGLSNNIVMDGIDATFGETNGAGAGSGAYINTIGLGAIAEFRTTSSVPSAEYGRAAGGILTITTRSGTNAFHGNVFEFFRNNYLDANTWANKHVTPAVVIPELRFNEFGGNLGGPILRNRVFFFTNYEGARVVSGASTTGNTPTPALIAAVKNPQIATELSFMPPVTTTTTNQYVGKYTGNLITATTEDTGVIRADVDFRKHRILTRFNINNQEQAIQQFRHDDSLIYPLRFYNAAVEDVWTVTPNLVNEVRIGLNRNDLARHNSTYDTDPTHALITVTGFFSTDNNQSLLHFLTTTYNFVDNLTFVHGRHTMSFGTDNRWLRSARYQDTNNISTYSSINSLISDSPTQVQVTFGTPKHFDSFQLAFYGQDNFRASRRLTLNYGLRYEYYTPLHGAFNVRNSDPFSPLSTNKNDPYFSEDRFNFAPRVGLIGDVLGNEKLVFRAAFGLMYLPPQPFFMYDSSFLDPRLPFNAILTKADVPANFSLSYPFSKAYVNQITANPSLLPSDILLGRQIANYNHADEYSENWNANLQYAVRKDLTLKLTYTALRDLHGTTTTLPNQFAPGACPTTSTCKARPDPSLGNINFTIYEGRTTYDGMYAQASYRRGANSADFYYTFASSIQEWSGNNNIGTGQSDVQDLLNPAGSRGQATGMSRNRIAASYTVTPPAPAFSRAHKATRELLGGYSLQSIIRFNTGVAANIAANMDLVRNGRLAGDRPDRVVGQSLYNKGQTLDGTPIFLNKAAFDVATPYAAKRYGNLAYNAVYGPRQINFNASIIKRIRIYKEKDLRLRAEFFNVMNHPNYSQPVLTITDASFGQVLSRSTPRYIQLGAEVRF